MTTMAGPRAVVLQKIEERLAALVEQRRPLMKVKIEFEIKYGEAQEKVHFTVIDMV